MDNIIIGFDFGTTNSVITYLNDKNNPIILKDNINTMFPTKLYFNNNKIYCGNNIPINTNTQHIISNFKNMIGTNFIINNKTENEILANYFNYIKNKLINHFPNKTFSIVLTVPSNFNDNQRNILMNISKKLNLNIIRIINEPTAAAFSYGLNRNMDEEKIMVFDIGGGTLDISILEVCDNFFETIDSFGDNHLGGNDFTNVIMNDSNLTFNQANKLKERLTWKDNVSFNDYELNNDKLKEISKELIDRIINLLLECKNKHDINHIIMVGGTSKLKILQDLIKDIFNIKPLIHNQIQHIVSMGACSYGGFLENRLMNEDIILLDTLPLSLGIETADGLFSVIVPKNTPLPIKKEMNYTVENINETTVDVNVYQGERSIAKDNYKIGEFSFDGITTNGIPVIIITFIVDVNNTLSINIRDKKTKKSKDILIRTNKLNDDEINNIIQIAEENKVNDDLISRRTNIFYRLQYKLENILDNINENTLIEVDDKNKIIDEIMNYLDELENYDIQQMIKLEKELENKYITTQTKLEEISETNYEKLGNEELTMDQVIFLEKQDELINLINFYMEQDLNDTNKNILIDIEKNINNYDYDELNNKINYIKQLLNDNEKEELYSMCIFIKNEIENNNLEINNNQKEQLINLINYYIDNFNSFDNYKNELEIFNNKCNEIYKNLN